MPCQPTNSGTGGKTTRLARANKEVTMVNDATLEGFRLSYGRGRSLSVISPGTMIADKKFGCGVAQNVARTSGVR